MSVNSATAVSKGTYASRWASLEEVHELVRQGETYGDVADLFERALQVVTKTGSTKNRKVFIVHGHDEAKRRESKDFLRDVGLEPVILDEQDDEGLTIIEKFEKHACTCAFAFVLLTPDDSIAAETSAAGRWRARQNAFVELGWFMANLQRSNVAILHRGSDLELPSDLYGILYLKFEISIEEVSERIRKRLRGVGLIDS